MPAIQLQTSNTTAPNRHPQLLAVAASYRAAAQQVLSFGCSTGGEVASLAFLNS
jgi:chemotaxis methyl-accepting protein methylase